MSTDIVLSPAEVVGLPQAAPDPAAQAMAIILRAAQDSSIDVGKMQALIAMHHELADRNARLEFNRAMVAAQSEIPKISKDGQILNKAGAVQSRYATIERIDDIIRPIYARHGFAPSCNTRPGAPAGKMTVVMTLRHSAGHQEFSEITLDLDTSGSKNGTQGGVSTFSYGERALLCKAFHIITRGEDDDGSGKLGEKITEAQCDILETLLADTKSDLSRFQRLYAIEELRYMPAERYQHALVSLEQKRQKLAGGVA